MSVTCSCVPDSFYFVSQAKLAWRDVQNYKNWSFFSVFSRLDSFPQVFGQVKGWLMLEFQKMRRVSHEVAFSIFFILWAKLAGRSVQNYEKWSFYSVVIRLSPFPQVFEQIKKWLTLQLHKIIRVSYLVAFPFFFFLVLWVRYGVRSVQSYEKLSFFWCFLAVWVFFHKFLGRLMSDQSN